MPDSPLAADTAAIRALETEPGTPLPSPIRDLLQARFNTRLDDVRIHVDEPAANAAVRLNANAFTLGQDIVFAPDRFRPATAGGQRLLAHEVAHTLQQRDDLREGSGTSDLSLAEHEAQAAAARVSRHPGAHVSIPRRPETRGRIQRDGPYQPGSAPPDSQLHLDPEIAAEIARIRFQRWLEQMAQGGGAGAPSSPTPDADSSGSPDSGGTVAEGQRDEDAGTGAADSGVTSQVPVPQTWLGIEAMGAESLDFGALLTPYFNRGLLPNAVGDTRDVDVIGSLFQQRYSLVLGLPDVREFLPGFAREWVPADWRVGLASALTSTTIDWALSGQHPTMFEVSNRLWDFEHGTTTIFTPQIPVPFVSDWWNDLSSGRSPR